MKTSLNPFVRSFASLATALLVLAAPAAVHAQAPKIFVASYGNDANVGTPVSPKRAFQAAHNAVAAGGQIVALDTAGYGALTITKSVSVIVPPGVTGFVTVSGSSNGITINAATTDEVSLRGLIIENSNASGNPFGIDSNSVGTLTVEDCGVRNFFRGINFNQTNAGRLQVHGGHVRQNSYGIVVLPAAVVALDAIVTDCLVENNGTGLYAFAGNGGSARLTAGECTISGNSTGMLSGGGGQIISFGNNSFAYNGSNGAFSSTTPVF